MTEPTTTIRVQLPDRHAPGFIRRERQRIAFMQRIQQAQALLESGSGAPTIDALTQMDGVYTDLIEFLLPFVVEPADRDAARAALLDASQEQIDALMAQMGPDAKNAASQPAPSAAPSDAG